MTYFILHESGIQECPDEAAALIFLLALGDEAVNTFIVKGDEYSFYNEELINVSKVPETEDDE